MKGFELDQAGMTKSKKETIFVTIKEICGKKKEAKKDLGTRIIEQ